MLSADTLQVGRMGDPERVGHRVVDVAELGGAITAREPTGQIPTPDEALQRSRRAVARFGRRIGGKTHGRDLGAVADKLG